MGILTFDWSQIAHLSTPLVVPWWAQVNIFLGFVAMFWIVMPALYYANVGTIKLVSPSQADGCSRQAFSSAYLPMLSSTIFDRFGNAYEATKVLDSSHTALNITAYAGYSAPFLPIAYVGSYSADFLLMTCMLVHTSLFHGPEIWRRLQRRAAAGDVDVHVALMKEYPDVPDAAYLAFLLLSLALAAFVISVRPFLLGRRRFGMR